MAAFGSPAYRVPGDARVKAESGGPARGASPGPNSPPPQRWQRKLNMNRIIWLVGAVVIVLFILGYFGLR
jgi:hypothetical protein